MSSYLTPVLFLVFNRPDNTEKVFNRIRELKPETLFVAADGPRKFLVGESELCKKVREIIDEGIDWDCKVTKLYRDDNLGCGIAVSSAITWFFEHVDEGVILEDDTLPDISFFNYCEDLLKKYRNSNEVMMISGSNFRLDDKILADSYTFTKYCHVWGWATWKRAWLFYDFRMTDWPELNKKGLLQRIFDDKFEIEYWENIFNNIYNRLEDTWDYQWYYTCWKLNGVAIEPAVNLVVNIGFGENATHTKGAAKDLIFGNFTTKKLIINQHPKEIKIDVAGDKITFKNRYLNGTLPKPKKNKMTGILKSNLLKTKNYFFPNTSFRINQRILKFKYLGLYIEKKLATPKLPVNEDHKVYVHLGCGEIDWPKFINVDVRAYNHVHYLHKVDTLPFFKDGTADLVYISHCLEHIPFGDAITALTEWNRVLKSGGKLRISVPDFDLLLKIYEDNNNDMNLILQPLMGGQNYKYNFHYNVFNFESLKSLLLEAGFAQVNRWEYGKDEFSSLPDFSGLSIYLNDKSYKVSLNVEAIK